MAADPPTAPPPSALPPTAGPAEGPSADALLADAAERQRAGRHAEAGELCALVLAGDPDHPRALFLAGVADWRTGRVLSGLDRLGRSLFLDPALADAHPTFIQILQDTFQIAESQLHAGAVDAFIALYVGILEARALAACSYLMRDHLPLAATASLLTALAHAEGVCRSRPPSAGVRPLDVDLLPALVALERGRIDEGAARLSALAEAAATADRRRIGRLLQHYKRHAAAAAIFRRLAAADPGCAEDIHGLARALFQEDRFEAAAALLRRAARLAPRNAAVHIDLGHVLHCLGRSDDALEAFRGALGIHPGLAWAYVGIGAIRQTQGRGEEAAAAFLQAVSLAPTLIEARIGAGSLLAAIDPSRALAHFREAVNLKCGLPLSPMPRAPGLSESLRGYCDLLHRHLRAWAASRPAETSPTPVSGDGASCADAEVLVGRLTPLAAIPGDGRYHVRDPAGRIAARRLAPPEALALTPPANHRPGVDECRFYGSTIFSWLARSYERFAWSAQTPFPGHVGCDGLFLSRIDGCRVVDGYVFSTAGDFHEESTKFDELVVFGRGGAGMGLRDIDMGRAVYRYPAPAARIGAPCRVLDGYHMFHYGAWLLNLTPKLLLLEEEEETRGLPLVLPRAIFEGRRFVREVLEALGIGADRLVLAGAGAWEFDRAYGVAAGTHILSPRLALAARRRLMEAFAVPERACGDRIFYVSRRDAAVRRVLNEDAVIEALERRGVEVVANADLALGDIVRRFAGARCVIGVNGAGMTNTLFCPRGATVIELCGDIMIEPLYWMISNLLGHRHCIQIEHSLNRQGDFVVSIDRLTDLLDRFA